jgi:hypothetical protein
MMSYMRFASNLHWNLMLPAERVFDQLSSALEILT